GRRLAVCVGMFGSAVLLWAGAGISSSASAITLLALGAGLNMFAATTFWATCIDLTEDYTASLSGVMNTFGNLGGWLSPIASGYANAACARFSWQMKFHWAATHVHGFLRPRRPALTVKESFSK